MSLLRTGQGRLRSGWRLVLFLGAAFLAALALQLLIWLLPGQPTEATLMILGPAVAAVATLLASWFVMERIEGMPVAALGLPLDGLVPRELGAGFLLGAAVVGMAVAALAVTGSVSWGVEAGGLRLGPLLLSLLQVTLFLAVAGWAEEILVRGYPLQALAESLGGTAAIGLTALGFGLLHLGNPGMDVFPLEDVVLGDLLPILNITLAGVVLGLAYWRTYSLWYATGVHLGWNWLMGAAADLPVSGMSPEATTYGFLDTAGIEATVQGPPLWTGGAFGPEGGLAVTAASLAAILWLATTDRLSRSLRIRALDPLPDRRAADGEGRTVRSVADGDAPGEGRAPAGTEIGRGAGEAGGRRGGEEPG